MKRSVVLSFDNRTPGALAPLHANGRERPTSIDVKVQLRSRTGLHHLA